ncbi:Kelch domain-containing protein 10 [Thelohanellus kitauei]|uniref:Kelch domain-containing protein 10 n=1 Tax=Thelohanellus kitauei TaxID=669202 RepID=A0A0C2MUY0_THEKT|nr:Kelch domain-containing protein 10 [Thelohanellus kitauei]
MRVENVISAPMCVYGLCMTSIGEYIITYGGWSHLSSTVCRELRTYNTVNGIWRRYPAPIGTTNSCVLSSICAVGNLVYIFGGTDAPYFGQSTNSLISFDASNARWQILSPHIDGYHPNTPPPMIESFIYYHNENIYILGGFFDNDYFDSMYRFCLKTSTWSLVLQKGQKPIINYRIFGTVFKDKCYTFGHSATASPKRFKFINIFDFSNSTWTTRQTYSKNQLYPDDRINESFAFSNNLGYLSGGESSAGYRSDIWRIDLETLEWFKLYYCLKARIFNHCMSVVNDCYLYSFGGLGLHPDRLNTLQTFIVRPPTLYRLCLESISKSPNLRGYAKRLPAAIIDEINFDYTYNV